MPEFVYSDRASGTPFDLAADGCALADWSRRYGQCRFARHPQGFPVFLAPARLDASNEYADADPYSVERNKENAFHVRRVEMTIALLREALAHAPQPPRILDLGCGEGHITEAIRKALDGVEIAGLDYSLSAIEYAHTHFPGIAFAVADAYESPYANECFDVVVCNNLWEHVPDPLVLLREIHRLVKPGGHLIISTPSRYRIGNLLRVLIGKPVAFMSAHHVTEYTVGQVQEQLRYGGFAIQRVASRPIAVSTARIKLSRAILSRWLSLVGSHHQLESTVFYLARKATRGAAGG
jgi:2-polyprenyl-3-methyl-5-hydroxy-6-metoxy-1,4-benzoquinol methylase